MKNQETSDLNVRIRAIQSADLDQVAALDALGYEFPWPRQVFLDCVLVGYSCWLIEADPNPFPDAPVWGHGIMSFGAGEAHVLNLCVHPALQRQGLGERMMRHLMAEGGKKGCHRIFLEVRQSMGVAQRLYKRLGFRTIGERRGYYPAKDGREDAWVMEHIFGRSDEGVHFEEM